MQENQYDPVGLELAGLTRETPGLKPLNQYKFNGKEFQPDLGLAWNHQDWRFFDPQIGRWHVVDPEIENGQENMSPYVFGFDNAVRYNDPDGRCPGGCPPAAVLPQVGALTAAVITALGEAASVVTGTAAAGALIVSLGYLVKASADAGGRGHPDYVLSDEPIYTSQAQYDRAHPTPSSLIDASGRVNANAGRGKNHLQPDEAATGPHSTRQTGPNGETKKYAEYTPNSKRPANPKTGNPGGHDEVKRVDLDPASAPHTNKQTGESVPVPHVQSATIPGGVRPARTDEIPKLK